MGKNEAQPKGDSIQVENRSNNVKKCFYVKNGSGKPICMSLASACEKKSRDCILALPKEAMDALSPVATILLSKTFQKCFF